MAKTERLYIRVDPILKKKIEDAAQEENRSVSNYLLTIVQNFMEEKDMTNNKEIYAVIENWETGGDIEEYSTLEAANAAAESKWENLTNKEMKDPARKIEVLKVIDADNYEPITGGFDSNIALGFIEAAEKNSWLMNKDNTHIALTGTAILHGEELKATGLDIYGNEYELILKADIDLLEALEEGEEYDYYAGNQGLRIKEAKRK